MSLPTTRALKWVSRLAMVQDLVFLEASPFFLPSGLKGLERVAWLFKFKKKNKKRRLREMKTRDERERKGGGGGFTCVVEKKE
jgi:hypothetical protein